MTIQNIRRSSLLVLAILAASFSGCASMVTARKAELPVERQTASNTYSIKIDSAYANEPAQVAELKTGLTVQQALDAHGLTKKYRTAEITLLRPVTKEGQVQVLKMACEFQPGKPLIKFEQDYSLHPGDRILISPKKSFFEKMLDN